MSLSKPTFARIPIVALFAMLLCQRVQSKVFTGENQNDRFTIHGRLSCYNGGSNWRIWVIGSTRILYSADDDTTPMRRLNKFFANNGGWFTHDVFGDFTVEPLARDVKGTMRPVRIIKIKNVVITHEGKVFLKQKDL